MVGHAAWDGSFPDGWTGGAPVTKYWNGDYLHLYRVTRPCGTCSATISLDVSKKALQGFTKNAGLLMKNCPNCRAQRRNGGPGSRGGTSRPTVSNVVAAQPGGDEDLERLRMANATMTEELSYLYAELKELKVRLAKYELPAAMAQTAKEKMPWGA
jgi:hypothetical protein